MIRIPRELTYTFGYPVQFAQASFQKFLSLHGHHKWYAWICGLNLLQRQHLQLSLLHCSWGIACRYQPLSQHSHLWAPGPIERKNILRWWQELVGLWDIELKYQHGSHTDGHLCHLLFSGEIFNLWRLQQQFNFEKEKTGTHKRVEAWSYFIWIDIFGLYRFDNKIGIGLVHTSSQHLRLTLWK